jgi:S-DNA-T family DNA segregation ATPase FtsK/SpoIIIE
MKVQSPEDSKEVLKTPLAAEIKEAGRAYLQVGNNERFDLFQSAYSGAPSSLDDSVGQEPFNIDEVSLSGRRKTVFQRKRAERSGQTDTQLEALVDYIADYCKQQKIRPLPGICLPPLEEVILYKPYTEEQRMRDKHGASEHEVVLPIGVIDDPANQTQQVASINLTEGSALVIGASQFGKTALLQLLIRGIAERYSPDECILYILDFSSMALSVFADLHHVGGVVTINDTQKLENFMKLIRREMSERKEQFSRLGITSYSSYCEAGHTDRAQIVIMIDGMIALKELNSELLDELMGFARDGLSVGISVVMTNPQGSGISYRFLNNFQHRIAFFCNSRDEYGSIFERTKLYPRAIPGRSIITIDKTIYELQTFLAFEGEREIERVEHMRAFIEDINQRYPDQRAVAIPTVPRTLDPAWVAAHPERRPLPYAAPIGLNYETVEYETVNLLVSTVIAIAGRPESGKTNFLRVIFEYLQANLIEYPTAAYIIDDYERQLEDFGQYGFVEQYSTHVKTFDTVVDHFDQTLAERLTILESKGAQALERMPLLLCVVQNKGIHSSAERETAEKYNRILSLYHQLKVCFIYADVDNFPINYSSGDYLRSVKEKNQIYYFDDLANIKLTDLSVSMLRANKQPVEQGDCFYITDRGVQRIKTIHYK